MKNYNVGNAPSLMRKRMRTVFFSHFVFHKLLDGSKG